MDFGIFTFGELSRNLSTGKALSPQQRLKEIIELTKLADQAAWDSWVWASITGAISPCPPRK